MILADLQAAQEYLVHTRMEGVGPKAVLPEASGVFPYGEGGTLRLRVPQEVPNSFSRLEEVAQKAAPQELQVWALAEAVQGEDSMENEHMVLLVGPGEDQDVHQVEGDTDNPDLVDNVPEEVQILENSEVRLLVARVDQAQGSWVGAEQCLVGLPGSTSFGKCQTRMVTVVKIYAATIISR